jgi:transposase
VLNESDPFSAEGQDLPPLGQRSDREAAHYYRSMHARAVQREAYWKQRALAGEQNIKQLLVFVGWCVQRIGALTQQMAWVNKQQFGAKSEATQAILGSAETDAAAAEAIDSERTAAESKPPADSTKRRRGQQPGAKGPKRKRRLNLPEQTTHHRIPESQLACSICGKVRPETGLTEESEEIEWEVCLVRHRHIRHRYGPSCDCPQGQGIITAPKPAKLIAKGLFAISFWVQVILKKFEFQQPLQRIVRELKAHDLAVSPGTLTGGLQKIGPMIQPLAGQFVLRSREGSHWHMDETRWPMFCLLQGEGRKKWWAWVVVSADVTAFLLEPTRSGQVPQNFFPKGSEGIVNADRFRAYYVLLGPEWKIQVAYCWSHQRRDFINLGEGCRRLAGWCKEWVGLINQLFAANRRRRQAWSKQRTDLVGPLDQEVRRQVQEIKERIDRELAGGSLDGAQEKLLKSMQRHWQGLTVFVDHAHVPMDNNAAERALRALAVARKNFYGSGALWSGRLACDCFTILATLRQHGICPRRYFQAYFEACARLGGKAPENLEEFLPWKWSAEKKAAWQTQEHAP